MEGREMEREQDGHLRSRPHAAGEVCLKCAAAAGIGGADCTALNGSGVRLHCAPYQLCETPATSETISFALRAIWARAN